jgi:hypothetical protein
MDCMEFMDSLPKSAFVMFDPPYISLILKYKYEEFSIGKLIESIPKLRSFDHWILYNDEVSKYLACLHDIPTVIQYHIKRGGMREREELVYTNLAMRAKNSRLTTTNDQ